MSNVYIAFALYHTRLVIYKNLEGELFFSTNGCLCTLGMRPSPTALRMALAIFLWFLGRSPVSFECFIRPISVMYSDIMVKFCGSPVSRNSRINPGHLPTIFTASRPLTASAFQCLHPRTLYSFTGLIPKTSKASCCGFLRPYFHFFCSVPLKSCGAYTSPGCHFR